MRRWEIDFIKLREYYVKAFPQYVIPPLIVEDADSESRQLYFQMFLDNLLKHEEFKATDYLVQFLTIRDDDQYKTYWSKIEKGEAPRRLYQYWNLEGKARLGVPSKHSLFVDEQKKHFINPMDEVLRE